MKPTLLVHEDPGQEQESHSPPSRRAAAPRLIPPGCKSGAGSHSIPRASMSSKRSAGNSPCPTPRRQPGVRTQGTPAHKNRAATRLAPPRRRVTIPFSSQNWVDRRPRYVCALPDALARSRAQPPARERAARAPAKATLADRIASPESGSAPLLLAGGGGGPPPLGQTLRKEAGRSRLASPAMTSAHPAPRSRLLQPVRAVL